MLKCWGHGIVIVTIGEFVSKIEGRAQQLWEVLER